MSNAAASTSRRTYRGRFADRVVNFQSGQGGAADPANKHTAGRVFVTYQEAVVLFTNYWMARKTIMLPIQDMLRNGRTFRGMTEEEERRYRDRWEQLDIDGCLVKALRYAHQFGGGAIIPVASDMDLTQEFSPSDIVNGQLRRFVVLNGRQLPPSSSARIDDDIVSEFYGMPDTFRYRSADIHRSHVIVAHGNDAPDDMQSEGTSQVNRFYGISDFCHTKEPILQAHAAYDMAESLMQRNNMDILKVPDLYSAIAACTTDQEFDEMQSHLARRVAVINANKSSFNTVVIDTEEEIDRLGYDMTSVPLIIREKVVAVSGASGIPLTRFAGVAPGGLNATGEGDRLNYEIDIGSKQRTELRPLYEAIDQRLTLDVFGEVRQLDYTINAPTAQSETEAEEIRSKRVTTIATLGDVSAVPESTVLRELQHVFPSIPDSLIKEIEIEERGGDGDEGDDDL